MRSSAAIWTNPTNGNFQDYPELKFKSRLLFEDNTLPGNMQNVNVSNRHRKQNHIELGSGIFGISRKSFPKEVVWHFNSNLVPFVLISCNGRSSKCILCYCLSGPSAIKRVRDCKKWGTLSWENIKNIKGNLKPHTSKVNNTGRGLQKRGTFNRDKVSKIL